MPAPIEPFYSELGRRISEIRSKRGTTQDHLGALLTPSTTRASIANIERGKQRVLVHTLVQLAKALQVEPVELLGGSPEPQKQKVAASVANELKTKLHLPAKQLERLRRELGLSERPI